MAPLRLVAIFALVTSCYRPDSPAYDTYPEPITVAGPPSGEIDPAWTQDQYAADPVAYPGGYGEGDGTESVEPSSDPNDAGYVMGAVTDAEIDTTLDAYGEWIDNGEDGRVWRPYATAVGVDFTPYESCGSWVWTDWGWTFACDWDWGWLPFHYGRWGWYDDYWAWQPDYEWSPGWVEWRGGGGYVGWRPLGPLVRDHRDGHNGPTFHDHRNGSGPEIRDHRKHRSMDSQWRFAANKDFGKRIKPNLTRAPAEGLRLTSTVTRPPVRPNYQPVHVASLMRGRLKLHDSIGVRNPRTPQAAPLTDTSGGRRPAWDGRMGGRVGPARRPYEPSTSAAGGSPSVYAPTYPTYQPPQQQRPSRGSQSAGIAPPDRAGLPSHTRPSLDPHPSRPSFDGGSSAPPPRTRPSFDAHPSRPSFDGGSSAPPPRTRPSYDPRPSRPAVDRAPSRPTWTPPSSPPPSRGTWSPPSSSRSSSSSGNWSPPSRPSSSSRSSSSSGSSRSSGSWGGSRSSGSSSSGSSRSSGGGGGGSRNHRR
jgi:hypothetical protein